jgi:hypothetical protein
MPSQRDIPRLIARWLFYIGCVWALILVPCLGIAAISVPFGLLSLDLRPLVLVVYIAAGYLIWIGWFWRSRHRGSLIVSAAFWLCSALFNSIFLIWGLATKPEQLAGEFFHLNAYNLWWWIAASIGSIVALCYEIILSEQDDTVA